VDRADAAGWIFKVVIFYGMIGFAGASVLGPERFDGVYTGKRSLTKGCHRLLSWPGWLIQSDL
jgi:hypothetical protein